MFNWMVSIQGASRGVVDLLGKKFNTQNKVEIKVSELSKILHSSPSQNLRSRIRKCNILSPLQLLWWASLLYGARGQLTDPFPAKFELSSLDGTNGFFIPGEAEGDRCGYSVSSAGDVNGDGIDDLVIGTFVTSPNLGSQIGKCYVVFGSRKMISGGTIDLAILDGIKGFMIRGEGVGDMFCNSVSGAGDVNGDGLADLVIGAHGASSLGKTRAGKIYVVFGSRNLYLRGIFNITDLNGNNGFVLNGEAPFDGSGKSVSGAGDVNGDGIADLVIGAYSASSSRKIHAGKSYVVFGSRKIIGGKIELASLNGLNGFILQGEASNDYSGISVSGAGDVNGDGLADLLIGASEASLSGKSRAGKSYVVFGSLNLVSGGTIELSSLDGSNGFKIEGEGEGDQSGISVSSAGDVNGDGLTDFLIGARYADPLGNSAAGKSYVVFGNRTPVSGGTLKLSSLDGKNGFILFGEAASDYSGRSVSSAGDVNGDGLSDIMIGAYNAKPKGMEKAGKSYLIYGSSAIVFSGTFELSKLDGKNGFILNGEATGDNSGRSVSSSGDVNGDGLEDFVIGASGVDSSGKFNVGKTYVIFGRQLSLSSVMVTQFPLLTSTTPIISPLSKKKQTTATILDLMEMSLNPLASMSMTIQNRPSPFNQTTYADEISSVVSLSSEQFFDRTIFIVMSIGAGILGLGCSILGCCLCITNKKSSQKEEIYINNAAAQNYDLAPPIDDDKQDNAINTNYQQMPQRTVGTNYEAF